MLMFVTTYVLFWYKWPCMEKSVGTFIWMHKNFMGILLVHLSLPVPATHLPVLKPFVIEFVTYMHTDCRVKIIDGINLVTDPFSRHKLLSLPIWWIHHS